MNEQHFQFNEGNSNKFWKIRLEGSSFTVHFGKVGTAGQVQTKQFATDAEAEKEYNKLVAEKVKKGYVEVSDGESVPAPVAPRTPAAQRTAFASATSAPPSSPSRSTSAPPSVAAQPSQPAPAVPSAVATLSPPSQLQALQASSIERFIDFNQREWEKARWGPKDTQKPKPTIKPFDLIESIAALFDMSKGPEDWEAGWFKQNVDPLRWSLEESHFWLVACSSALTMAYEKVDKFRRVAAFEGDDPAKLTAQLRNFNYRSNLSYSEVEQIVTGTRGRVEHFTWLCYPLARLLTPSQYVDFWMQKLSKLSSEMFWGFRTFIVPYLSNQELADLRMHARNLLGQTTWSVELESSVPIPYQVASALAMKDELLSIVERWPDRRFTNDARANYSLEAQTVVLGLKDADLIMKQFKRLGLKLCFTRDLFAWIGLTGHDGLDVVYDSIMAMPEGKSAYVDILMRLISPEAARYIFLINQHTFEKVQTKKWMEDHPMQVIEGLADLAQEKGNDGQAARRHVRDLAMRYGASTFSPSLRAKLIAIDCPIGGDTAQAGTAAAPPHWLAQALNTVQPGKKTKLPDWLSGVATEAIIVEGWRFTDEQIEKLLSAIQQTGSGALIVHPLIEAIRQHADRRQFDRFVWDLFSRWVEAGGPPKDKWAMFSLGMIGSEKLIQPLLPMMYEWREKNLTARAQAGLEVLRFYGSDFALMRMHEISQSPRLKSLRSRALEIMDEIAMARKMTKPELEDRIVPTCGLDADGSRTFDFGARKFTFAFGPDLKPMVKDEKGVYKTDLPAPNQKDDAQLARTAVEDWKELKKQLKTIAKIQARRLEQSMVTCRSWTREDFEALLLNHPLMTNLMRMVVWAAFDKDLKLMRTFRVMEDRSLADENDRQTTIDGATRIAVIHPLNMSDDQKSKWGEIFTDYEITALFPQIGRPIYSLEPSEKDGTEIKRFKKVSLPSASVPGTLERLGWWRGPAEDGGVYHWHYKHFYEHNISAVVTYDPGIPMQMMQDWDDQSLESCFFVPVIFKGYWQPAQPMPLGKVPPIIISEVLYDLHTLTSHGKEEEED